MALLVDMKWYLHIVVSFICISLSNKIEHLFMYLLAILISSWIRVLCSFKLSYLLLSCRGSLYILNIKSLSDIWFAIFFPFCRPFHFLNNVFWYRKFLIILKLQTLWKSPRKKLFHFILEWKNYFFDQDFVADCLDWQHVRHVSSSKFQNYIISFNLRHLIYKICWWWNKENMPVNLWALFIFYLKYLGV